MPASSHVQVALLCSYRSVGRVGISLGLGGERTYDLRWSDRSSQQCIVDVGRSAAKPPIQELRLRVASERAEGNLVKVFGVYTQAMRERPSPLGAGDRPGARDLRGAPGRVSEPTCARGEGCTVEW